MCAAPVFVTSRKVSDITPIRRCAGAVMLRDFCLFQQSDIFASNHKLLELGCGSTYYQITRQLCTIMGMDWSGVDRRAETDEKLKIYRAKVRNLPFEDNTFGAAFSIHSFEHWGTSVKEYVRSMNQLHRVLTPGGQFYAIAPIWAEQHGHTMFQSGDIDGIMGLFDAAMWNNVRYEEWRKDYQPLPHYNMVSSADKSEWNINIIATKK